MSPKISVAIPTYTKGLTEVNYLRECFNTISKQSFKNYEVIVSDNSSHSLVYELYEEYIQYFPSISYFKNLEHIGMSANSNFAMQKCKGEYIKILHCDDLLYSTDALKIIVDNLDTTDSYWLVNGFNHTTDGLNFFDPRVPRYPKHLLIGNNLIGCPTNITIKKSGLEYYDENIHMGMDVEWYHRIRMKYGMPLILENILTTSRITNNNTTSKINLDILVETEEGSWENVQSELDYIQEKHKDFFDTWEYPNG